LRILGHLPRRRIKNIFRRIKQEDQKYLQEDQEEFGQEDQAYYIQGNKNNNNMKDFEMFTDEGNRACTEAFENIYNVIFGDKFISEAELKNFVKEQIAQVEENYEEVRDTEPEWHFENRINKVLEIRGYAYRVNRYNDF